MTKDEFLNQTLDITDVESFLTQLGISTIERAKVIAPAVSKARAILGNHKMNTVDIAYLLCKDFESTDHLIQLQAVWALANAIHTPITVIVVVQWTPDEMINLTPDEVNLFESWQRPFLDEIEQLFNKQGSLSVDDILRLSINRKERISIVLPYLFYMVVESI